MKQFRHCITAECSVISADRKEQRTRAVCRLRLDTIRRFHKIFSEVHRPIQHTDLYELLSTHNVHHTSSNHLQLGMFLSFNFVTV